MKKFRLNCDSSLSIYQIFQRVRLRISFFKIFRWISPISIMKWTFTNILQIDFVSEKYLNDRITDDFVAKAT